MSGRGAFLAALARARGQVDALLGRVTPVVLVAIALILISLYAVLLSALHEMPFSPLDALVSFAVAGASTVAGTFAGAAVARVRARIDSTLVTALLVFLILTPSLEPAELAGIAVAGLAAGLSKFVLAWRGRHAFNPAALGVTVAWLTGLSTPGWWVGSAPMLWLVAILAVVVLYRTQTLLVGLLYVVIAVGGTLASLPASVWSFSPGMALALPFTSLPYVFLAGFMLSEPLTLPPRRWQRLLVAAVVGVCSFLVLALRVEVNFSPPQVALLVGNLLAFGFGARRALRFEVDGLREAGTGVMELALRPLAPVRFAPGQAIELAPSHTRADLRGQLRMLSIASAPEEAPLRVAFGVPGSRVSSAKRALLALRPGDRIDATRVLGDFTLPRSAEVPILLVAGGIGVTPFLSMLRANAAASVPRDIVLVYRASTERPAYVEELAAIGARVVPFFERRPDAAALLEAVPDLAARVAYVSGPPGMVAALTSMLRRAGVRRVRRDVFSGA